jgi:hypothetical protein
MSRSCIVPFAIGRHDQPLVRHGGDGLEGSDIGARQWQGRVLASGSQFIIGQQGHYR